MEEGTVIQLNEQRAPPSQGQVGGQDDKAQGGGAAPTDGSIPEHLVDALEDAQRLIAYAAEIGLDIDEDVRRKVLEAADAKASGKWSAQSSLALLAALTTLTCKLRPVSGESLRKCQRGKEAAKTLTFYRRFATFLGLMILPYSIIAFVASTSCQAIQKDIETANSMAVAMGVDLHLVTGSAPTADEDQALASLQQFTATFRALDARALMLRHFTFLNVTDPFEELRHNQEELDKRFELPAEKPFDVTTVAREKIRVYQQVRHFANSVQERVSVSFGAITSGLLPILYALLGACALLIRTFEGQIKLHTFTGAHYSGARFLIAGISGLVVGLFGNFASDHGTALSPLAIAFLVGYAVDVFFSFLEGLLRTFGQNGEEGSGVRGSSAQTKGAQPTPATQ